MAKFLFLYFHVREGIIKDGNPKGGSMVETLNWMKALHGLGHEVFQATHENDDREVNESYNWIKPLYLYHSDKYKKRLVWFTYRIPKLYLALKRNKIDFIYLAMPRWPYYFFGLICKMTKTKQILRLANDKNVDESLSNEGSFLNNFFKRKTFQISDFVVAQNQFQYETLQKKYNIKYSIKLSNPIVLDKRYLKQKQEVVGYLAWLANFRHQKNLKLLFEVASLLQNENFKVAGQPLYPMDDETTLYLEKLKGLKNVEFVGVVPNPSVLGFLGNAKFLLSTSRYEGFSNTFLESMVAGTPILTTPSVNPDGIIEDFELGYLYKDADELKYLLDNITFEDYQKKSKNVIKYVQEHHDHLVLGQRLVDFLYKRS